MYLVIGGDSEIGAATARLLRSRGGDVAVTTRRRTGADRIFLDIETLPADWTPPKGIEAACIFVAVARLADCEKAPERARHINCTQTLLLAEKLAEAGVYTLYLSTNQVFDGTRPHVSADEPTAPVSVYGRQKADAEAGLLRMMEAGAPVGILRLAKVVSPGMTLLAGWRDDLTAGREISAFSDMTMAPAPVDLVAKAIALMMENRETVVAQLTGPRDLSYAEVGRLIARTVGASEDLVSETSARDHGMPEGATPQYTTLDSSYLAEKYGLRVPPPEQVVLGTALSMHQG